jgi:ElaB/YqjD/DUF883 family membrane-anchored ribosome-binding protein
MSDNFEKMEKKAKEIFEDLYDKMEDRVKGLSEKLKEDILPVTEEKLRKNVFKTVLISFGVGLLTGIIISAIGSGRGKKK